MSLPGYLAVAGCWKPGIVFKSALRFNSKLSVLMMDIDHFKKVNDDHGHCVGDEVLKETASRCSEVLREVDHFGRLGGEEFLVILPIQGCMMG